MVGQSMIAGSVNRALCNWATRFHHKCMRPYDLHVAFVTPHQR